MLEEIIFVFLLILILIEILRFCYQRVDFVEQKSIVHPTQV